MIPFFIRLFFSYVLRALAAFIPKSVGERWRKLSLKAQWALVVLSWVIGLGGPVIWEYFTTQGAFLYGHNHTDRPLFNYSVNGYGGGNGGVTCCWAIGGDRLTVAWIKGRTGEQVRQGLKKEEIKLLIPNPPRKRSDIYLHVHFFPGDQVRVAWSPNHDSPYEKLKEAPSIEETP